MKEKDWIIDMQVQYDQEHIVKLRYGVRALTAEIALVRAGVRASTKMRGVKIVDASIAPAVKRAKIIEHR